MLKLIKCEFLKLKRKKFIPLIILAAFLFPIPLTYLMTTPSMMERYTDQADAFDGLFNMVLGYGIQFLLPCIIGVIAAILFFMERDNDTFKNLRTIPVTSTQMVLAKIIVLRWNLSRGFSAKHNVSENSVQNICRAVSPQRMRIIGSMVFFYL